MAHPNELNNDPIDIGSFLSRLRSIVLTPIRLTIKYKKTVVVHVCAWLLFSLLLRFAVPPVYRATFIIRPSDPKERFHLRIIGDLATLAKQKNHGSIARLLAIDTVVASELESIELYNPSFKQSPDSINFTEVGLIMKTNKNFEVIQTALLNYLHSNPYFKKIREVQNRQIELTENRIKVDLMELDSLKQLQQDALRHSAISSQVTVSDFLNPVAAYTLAIDRVYKQGSLEGQKAFLDNFQLIKATTAFDRPAFPPRLLILILLAIGAGIVTALLHVVLKHGR